MQPPPPSESPSPHLLDGGKGEDAGGGGLVGEHLDEHPGVHYLHGLFDEETLLELEREGEDAEISTSARNMLAERRFVRSPKAAGIVLKHLPAILGLTHVLTDVRFINYPVGGFIAPHVDGVRVDDGTLRQSTTTFLLYLSTVPEGEGGETETLTQVNDGEVINSYRPQRGSILVFPHGTPHQGAGVGTHPKALLRGDMY